MIITARPRWQRRAVRRGIGCYMMLAGLLLCTQVSCGGNTGDAEGIESTDKTAANQAPNGVITNPTSNVSITAGGTVNLTGSGSDPDNNLPLSYLWAFGAGSGIPDSTAQNPGVVQFNNPGIYTVSLTVRDNLGLANLTPATRVVTVSGGNNQAPNGVITNPTSNVSITVGGTVNFTGSGSDPDNNLPLTYLWNFGAGSGVLASTAQNPGPVQFNNLGIFTVNFTVTDSLGLTDPTPASDVITVNGGTLTNTSWSLKFVDSEELNGSDIYPGVNGFDGNTGTMWHTAYRGLSSPTPLPHEIQINLGRSANLNGFVYVPRQDGFPEGRIGQYEFYVSPDGVNWGSPVATGTFANTATGKQVSFAPKVGQFVRLRALSEVNGLAVTSMAELNLLGQCIAPAVKLAQPRSLDLQTSTTLNVVANACLDSVTQSGWGVQFVLDGGPAQGGAQVDTHTAPFQVQFANLSLAEHRVEAFIIDNAGVQVAGTATQDQANPVGIGNYFVAMGDSITRGSRDDIASDNTSQDGRNTGGGYEPILNNLRTTAKHYPQTVANEGVSAATSTDGVSLIPSLLSRHPNAQYFLILYGNSDSAVPVPSGSGLHPGDAGYPGTFKDNMQRIITAVKNAGKQPYLAKNPPAYQNFSARDPLIRAYNQVIDQLVGENNIMVVPPDFYTWFANHQNELFDGDHPNGIGYQSMANLWQSALP